MVRQIVQHHRLRERGDDLSRRTCLGRCSMRCSHVGVVPRRYGYSLLPQYKRVQVWDSSIFWINSGLEIDESLMKRRRTVYSLLQYYNDYSFASYPHAFQSSLLRGCIGCLTYCCIALHAFQRSLLRGCIARLLDVLLYCSTRLPTLSSSWLYS